MPAFPGFSVEDRFALAHYIREFDAKAPSADADTAEVLASLGIGAAPKPKLSIAVAMERSEVPSEQSTTEPGAVYHESATDGPGERLYGQMCMSCHGANGQGALAKNVGVQSPLRIATKALTRYSSTQSQGEFVRALTESNPSGLHGYGALSNAQWNALYEYVRSLR